MISVFSKKAYACVLKTKTGSEVAKAFASVLSESDVPKKVQTDEGKEFFNKTFKALIKKHSIIHFATSSDLKASVIERFNRTLKTRMWRYFTAINTQRYIDVLQNLLKSYNNSYHCSIKMKPNQVTHENTPQVFQNLYGTFPLHCKNKLKINLKESDVVRISEVRGVFDKKYEQSYTDVLFSVSECISSQPPSVKYKRL